MLNLIKINNSLLILGIFRFNLFILYKKEIEHPVTNPNSWTEKEKMRPQWKWKYIFKTEKNWYSFLMLFNVYIIITVIAISNILSPELLQVHNNVKSLKKQKYTLYVRF